LHVDVYDAAAERTMKAFYRSLSEKDKRRYAAVEVSKLDHGGTEYISRILGIDPKTIRQGIADLENTEALEQPRVRKKGAVARPR
jgi:predicted ArsR family transcriptional regulator